MSSYTKKRKQNAKRQRAGAYIARGTYGCVFGNPPLPCAGEAARRPDSEVSKLVDENKDLVKELRAGVSFLAIDPENKYFLTQTHDCTLDRAAVTPEDELKSCNKHATRNRLIFYPMGGESLLKVPLKSEDYIPFIKSLENLFIGLHLAHTNDRFHMDLKPENIVSKKNPDESFTTRYIDLGMSMFKGEPNNPVFVQPYKYWPLELFFSKYIYEPPAFFEDNLHYPIHDTLDYIYEKTNNRVNNLDYIKESVPNQLFMIYARLGEQIYSLCQRIYASRNNLAKVLYRSADIFGLGMTLAEVFLRLFGHSPIGSQFTVSNMMKLMWPQPERYINTLPDSPLKTWSQDVMVNITVPLYKLVLRLTNINFIERSARSLLDYMEDFRSIYPHIERLCTPELIQKFASKNLTRFSEKYRVGIIKTPVLKEMSPLAEENGLAGEAPLPPSPVNFGNMFSISTVSTLSAPPTPPSPAGGSRSTRRRLRRRNRK